MLTIATMMLEQACGLNPGCVKSSLQAATQARRVVTGGVCSSWPSDQKKLLMFWGVASLRVLATCCEAASSSACPVVRVDGAGHLPIGGQAHRDGVQILHTPRAAALCSAAQTRACARKHAAPRRPAATAQGQIPWSRMPTARFPYPVRVKNPIVCVLFHGVSTHTPLAMYLGTKLVQVGTDVPRDLRQKFGVWCEGHRGHGPKQVAYVLRIKLFEVDAHLCVCSGRLASVDYTTANMGCHVASQHKPPHLVHDRLQERVLGGVTELGKRPHEVGHVLRRIVLQCPIALDLCSFQQRCTGPVCRVNVRVPKPSMSGCKNPQSHGFPATYGMSRDANPQIMSLTACGANSWIVRTAVACSCATNMGGGTCLR